MPAPRFPIILWLALGASALPAVAGYPLRRR